MSTKTKTSATLQKIIDVILRMTDRICTIILRISGYAAPKTYRKSSWLALASLMIPVVSAGISVILLTSGVTFSVWIVHLCCMSYKYLLAKLEDWKYQREYEQKRTSASRATTDLYSKRCTIIAVIFGASIALPIVSMFFPQNVPASVAFFICVLVDILTNFVLEVINALVLWSGAMISKKHIITH